MQKTRGKTNAKIPQKRKRNKKPVKPAMKTKLTGQKVLETSQNRKKSSAQMLVGWPIKITTKVSVNSKINTASVD
jgi:hypothetical protein